MTVTVVSYLEVSPLRHSFLQSDSYTPSSVMLSVPWVDGVLDRCPILGQHSSNLPNSVSEMLARHPQN